jgi:predicted transcriptional regulator
MTGFLASFDAYRPGGYGKDRAFWLQTDNGGPYSVTRARRADGGGGSVIVPNLSCCFIGGIQLDKLHELASTLHDDGFIQRSFVILASRDYAEADRVPNLAAKQAHYDLMERLVQLGPTQPIRLSPEAHSWRRQVEEIAEALIVLPTTPRHMIGHLKKWRGKFVRLLLLSHVIERVSCGAPIEADVSGDTARRAHNFMLKFLLPHQLTFYSRYFGKADGVAVDAKWIAGHILAHRLPEITASTIKRVYKPNTTPLKEEEIALAMTMLEHAGWVGSREDNFTKRSITWKVNARVHELFAERAAIERADRNDIMRRIKEAAGRVRQLDEPEEPEEW